MTAKTWPQVKKAMCEYSLTGRGKRLLRKKQGGKSGAMQTKAGRERGYDFPKMAVGRRTKNIDTWAAGGKAVSINRLFIGKNRFSVQTCAIDTPNKYTLMELYRRNRWVFLHDRRTPDAQPRNPQAYPDLLTKLGRSIQLPTVGRSIYIGNCNSLPRDNEHALALAWAY